MTKFFAEFSKMPRNKQAAYQHFDPRLIVDRPLKFFPGLRMAGGIGLDEYGDQFCLDIHEQYGSEIARLIRL